MRISEKPSPVQIITDQKQLDSVELFSYLGSVITNDSKSRVRRAKSSIQQDEDCTSRLGLN
jgi:hypothetical protein